MTSNSYEKLRAVFLSVLMVVSVFGATVALSGGAAAAANDLTVNPNPAGDEEVQVSAVAETAGNDLSFAIGDILLAVNGEASHAGGIPVSRRW